jgi:hypothetical protein
VTVEEALSAEQLLAKVDAMTPADRSAFIQQHRAQLNQALMTEQVIVTIRHTVEVTSRAAQRIYHRGLLCGLMEEDERGDDQEEAIGPPSMPQAPLTDLVAAFNAHIKGSLKLADGPETEARLRQIDVTDVIANGMIEKNKCVKNVSDK